MYLLIILTIWGLNDPGKMFLIKDGGLMDSERQGTIGYTREKMNSETGKLALRMKKQKNKPSNITESLSYKWKGWSL